MIELALAGAPVRCLFFGREELPAHESALAPLLAREPLAAELVVMMEPTANELHAGCLGNINATWTFHGRSGPLRAARGWPTTRSSAPPPACWRSPRSRRVPHAFDGLEFVEVASVTRIAGGIADERDPRPRRVPRQLPLRARPRARRGRGAARRAVRGPRRAADRLQRAVRARWPPGPRVDALVAAGDLARAPKQAWTPVAEFGLAGLAAVNFGPGEPAQAHRRDESVEIAALVRAYEVLERFAA